MLLTACDDGYLSEAEVLIKSCAKYEPAQRFYLFLVSSDLALESLVKAWHPNIIIDRVARPYSRGLRSGMLFCVRSIALRKALEIYREPTVYLDSDTLLRGELRDVFKDLETFDLMVKYRPHLKHFGVAGTPYGSTFNSGVIAVRPSAAGIRFARGYDRRLQGLVASERPLTRYQEDIKIKFVVDQELLYVTYLDFRDELLFKALPDRFNDARFGSDSIVWHGKGTARTDPRYVLEKLRYSNRFLFCPFSVYVSFWNFLRSIKHKLILE